MVPPLVPGRPEEAATPPAVAFRAAGQADLAPPGQGAKLTANLEALELLSELTAAGRRASSDERRVLARWSGWGSLPQVFNEDDARFVSQRARLRGLLGGEEAWTQARRTTLNAHYTSADVVAAVWRSVEALGFDGGWVLEPGCGSGNFIGLAPEGAEITGVELDRTTASIAEHLYGERATIRTGRFEDFAAPPEAFDLVVGNVPFAKVVPHDPRFNPGRHVLHNYFLLKALHLTRPGGLVAALSSRYTLDARNPAARREMSAVADLVGAVRLPSGAFGASAGTDVVADLVVLRRRPVGEAPAGPRWERALPTSLGDETEPVVVNELFVGRPDLVVGRLAATGGMYRHHELSVEPTGPLVEGLDAALTRVVDDARRLGLRMSPRRSEPPARHLSGDETALAGQEGSFVLTPEGLTRRQDGVLVAYQPRVRGDSDELRRLVGLRDAARQVLAVQATSGDDAELAAAQVRLSQTYESYLRLHGPLNRYRLARTGRVDPLTGEDIQRRMRPRMGGFRDDPDWPLVAALEVFDDDTQRAEPAAIFTTRVIAPHVSRLGVDTAAEAVAVCLDEAGEVRLDRVAELLGTSADHARAELGQQVWDDPETPGLVPSARYLSGDVRRKLDAARVAAEHDPRFTGNVSALEAVLPRQLQPGEIAAQLGAPWIPAVDVEAFCDQVLDAGVEVEHLSTLGRWAVSLRLGRRSGVALSSEWGTGRADAITLLDASLNQRLHTVTDATESGGRVRNDAETLAARAKQQLLGDRFTTWIWEEPARGARLAHRYNELFCSVVVPTHDGAHLTLPGLARSFVPCAHQRDAVAQILNDGRALLAHAVGAGKTATMVIAAMELRRLQLATKPAVVVPNHMLEQFTREWLQLYPTAKVLLADRDRLSKERRKEFVARCATGDWDAVVFTQSGFARLPVGHERLAAYLDDELSRARAALAESRSGKGLSVKKLEQRIASLQESVQRALAEHRHDDGVCFEETGVDYLFVDEAHLYKNRRVDSLIEGMSKPGSQRASDLDAKLWSLRRDHGGRVVTFATATPVANSMAELWVMQTYLQPDVLAAANLGPFDAWAATFGRTVTALELAPDGASYRLQTRFSRFQNVPELMTLYRQVADVRSTAELDLPTPALAGGSAETMAVPGGAALRAYVAGLAERAEAVRNRHVDPAEDNMLKITGDGRRAALDLRLVGEPPDADGGKLRAAADRITSIHQASRTLRFLDEARRPHARPGAVQLVFCDVSTPAATGWNAYDELRGLLVERGVPSESVRFVHEAGDDDAKARLFAACRDGRVAVLVGSTEKMGVGTNVQSRAVALHHLDCPWRPADIEQREGRILRQGNQNPEVQVVRYVTEGSFDTYMWQTLERKAGFIAQVTSGRVDGRDVDDIGDQALSFAEVKALATGDPLILEKATVDTEVARLTRLQRAHGDDQHRLERTARTARARAERAESEASALAKALTRRRDTSGDRFTMTVGDRHHTDRTDAGADLKSSLCSEGEGIVALPTLGELAGFRLSIEGGWNEQIAVRIIGTPIELRRSRHDWSTTDPHGLVRGLEQRIAGLGGALEALRKEARDAHEEAARASVRVGLPFEHQHPLAGLRQRKAEIDETLVGSERSAVRAEGDLPARPPQRSTSSPTATSRSLGL